MMCHPDDGLWSATAQKTFISIICTLPNIIRVIRSRSIRWEGHVAYLGQMRNAYKILVGKFEGKRSLGRSNLDGMIILK
jgi:hypothetical protein